MEKQTGFSFVEILVALAISTTSMVLLLSGFIHRERLLNHTLIKNADHSTRLNQYESHGLEHYTDEAQGFGFIEIMLVLALASFLLAGLMQVYVAHQLHHKKMNLQLNEAFDVELAEQLIRHNIRSAGFTPCMPIGRLITDDGEGQRLQPYFIEREPNTALHLYRMDKGVTLQILDQKYLHLDEKYTFHEDSAYLIADCYHAEIVHPVKAAGLNWESDHEARFKYVPPIYIGLWLHEVFLARASGPSKGLTYIYRHPEILTPWIQQLFIEPVKSQSQTRLRVKMMLSSGAPILIETAIRAS